jgi:hypothetical protein
MCVRWEIDWDECDGSVLLRDVDREAEMGWYDRHGRLRVCVG